MRWCSHLIASLAALLHLDAALGDGDGDGNSHSGQSQDEQAEIGRSEFNATLSVANCDAYFQSVRAHDGGSFWKVQNLEKYNRCLFLLRHSQQPPRRVSMGGVHFPTMLVANHREPWMRLPSEGPLPVRRKQYASLPLQPFQDSQQEYEGRERRVPHHFVVPTFDVNIGNAIIMQGSMNHHQSYQMQMMLRPGDVALDIGGNLGCYTVAMAEAVGPTGRVLAFEPFRLLHQQLTANVALNGLMNVWPVNVAAGAEERMELLLPPQVRFFSSPGGVRVDGQAQHTENKPHHEVFQLYDLLSEPERVRVMPLDRLLLDEAVGQQWGLPVPLPGVRLIKIDVEGMEASVIRGAAELIRSFLPLVWAENIAYFESNGQDTTFLSVMAQLGYTCSKVESAPQDMLCFDANGNGHQP